MSLSEFITLFLILEAGCITPGPNNALLSASGMNFGYKRTLPHIWGVILGHSVMEFIIALGFGELYLRYPMVQMVLEVVAVVLLLWLAYKVATAPVDSLGTVSESYKPWTFWQAFLFQWINPKAWLIAIGISGQYAGGPQPLMTAIYIAIATVLAGVVSANVWAGFGVAMARILNTPTKRRIFNVILALLIVASVFMLLGL